MVRTTSFHFIKIALLLLFLLSYIVNGDISDPNHRNADLLTPRHMSSSVRPASVSPTTTIVAATNTVEEGLTPNISLRTLLRKKKKNTKKRTSTPTQPKTSPPPTPSTPPPTKPPSSIPQSPPSSTTNLAYSNDSYEVKVLQLTNIERSKQGLKPLQYDALLAKAARTHSTNMVALDFYGHTGADGSDFYDRMIAAGFTFETTSWTAGENVAAGQVTPEAVMEAWMNSPGHRANILNGAYTKLGVGHRAIAVDPGKVTYGVYWTQVFYGGN